jgi:4-diphosphocytidyl-2C-methyl-D-erythritol kinase
MSGSGSSYFGLCWTARQALRIAAAARQAGLGVAFATRAPAA